MKTPEPPKENPSAPNSAKHTRPVRLSKRLRFTPRQLRLAKALADGRWVCREDVDSIVGASNGPDVVLQLRRRVTGDDGIEMRMVDGIDRDGQGIKFGQYRMTLVGKQRAVHAGLLPNELHPEARRNKPLKASEDLPHSQGDLFALGVIHGKRA